ncbi:MAG: hypothetical protein WCX22_08670 [Methanoregula sp.]
MADKPCNNRETAEYKPVIPGLCMSAPVEKVWENNFVLTPGRYGGAEGVKDDGKPFDEKMKRLTGTLHDPLIESHVPEYEIQKNL